MRLAFFLSLCLGATVARAGDAPRVAVDIAPVHSLVAQVMAGAGEPDLIITPGASPHHYALRPSEATALAEAGLVIWVGKALTPWMETTIETLAPEARRVALLQAPGTQVMEFRTGVGFEHGSHGGEDVHEDKEAHEDEHEPAHEEDAHDDDSHEVEHEHAHEHGHEHGDASDPHAWLSPENARIWLDLIAEELASLDPGRAELYRANARQASEDLSELETEIEKSVRPARGVPFLVFHDAYQYFETAFDIHAAAAISLSDASRPGPARIAELRQLVADRDITCALNEPQFDPKLAGVILDGNARVGVVDPMGAGLSTGPGLYAQMMRALAAGFASCSE